MDRSQRRSIRRQRRRRQHQTDRQCPNYNTRRSPYNERSRSVVDSLDSLANVGVGYDDYYVVVGGVGVVVAFDTRYCCSFFASDTRLIHSSSGISYELAGVFSMNLDPCNVLSNHQLDMDMALDLYGSYGVLFYLRNL